MENQHTELNQLEIALMNEVNSVGDLLGEIECIISNQGSSVDAKWVAVGKTHLQQGLMAWTRAITRPEGF